MHKFPSPSFPVMGRSVRLIVSSSTLHPLPTPSSSSMLIAASPFRSISTSRPVFAFGLAPGRSKYENSNGNNNNNTNSYDRPNRSNDRRPPRRSYDDGNETSSYSRYGNDDRRVGRNNNSFSKPSYQDKSKMYASRGCYNVSPGSWPPRSPIPFETRRNQNLTHNPRSQCGDRE